MTASTVLGWERLRHGGLLLDAQRLGGISDHDIEPLPSFFERELRKRGAAVLDGGGDVPEFVTLVLQSICGFTNSNGSWQRGSSISPNWGRVAITGEIVKPRQLWKGHRGGVLPVFVSREKRLGIGRGRKVTSQVLQWLRAGDEQLALLTNGRQWRLLFAGLDFDAWCEWDLDLWFEEGELSAQVDALRSLLSPTLWTPEEQSINAPLLQAILDSRKGQAELSTVLGERVREAVELLVQVHGEALKEQCGDVDPADIYRAAVRIVMRMVVVLFSESRELLPRDNALYHSTYGLNGLLEDLERTAARGGNRLARSWSAWPRMQALFRLIYEGCHHPALPVPSYGGELFAPGDTESTDALTRALAVFETACFEREILPDRDVHRLLERITRTRVKVRQGRTNTWVPAPVDFSDLSSEYIGILYEGLLDFELKTAPAGDPIIFLAVGNQPALPLSRLEGMDDKALKNLLEEMKGTNSARVEVSEDEGTETDADEEEQSEASTDDEPTEDGERLDGAASTERDEEEEDERHSTRTRAEVWARHAVEVGKLARKPRGKLTPEKKLVFEQTISNKSRQLVERVILPGEWYLVRWGGTRKGSGTFYTRPGLAVPTVHRTLRPLAWNMPLDESGKPDRHADPKKWTPKKPEEILQLKVVDPACGSGTFPVAALRFLTESLYTSLHFHKRFHSEGSQTVVSLFTEHTVDESVSEGSLGQELLPSRPDDPEFEPRLKARLRRHVVERCIYGVDLDPLAVELCRLSLWIETMDRSLPFSFLDHKIKCGNALIGAWFDQFQHYPVMAFKNREGGDKNHNNGVHFERGARTKAIKAFAKNELAPSLVDALRGQATLFSSQSASPEELHAKAVEVLSQIHELPLQESGERARLYREEFLESNAYRSLKASMDLWCGCWFWPVDELSSAPLPSDFAMPSEKTLNISSHVAQRKRFFHWELEFPDVFRSEDCGFDAVVGNPPWETLQPNPEEFFSNLDPLFRTYGNLQKKTCLRSFFESSQSLERTWLDYCEGFNSDSHWVSYTKNPFGDPESSKSSQSRFSIVKGKSNAAFHARWRTERARSCGFSSPAHTFRHQTGRLFTYKLFMEQCHSLAREKGRLGLIVPSGIHSNSWSQPLRELFLRHCRWEWLFCFENREGIFDIHRSLKFNVVIIEKGGTTDSIQTAFMRRRLEDWECAKSFATRYSLDHVERFSPKSKVILEIRSERDLQILEAIYANSVPFGEDQPAGWGIRYKLEFMMNTDAHLFPPLPKWERENYRPDEYSRWLKGNWRPIEELWTELKTEPMPSGERRCAQPPYDTLSIPRADIPEGVILSRLADAWIRKECVENSALPLYEGRMVGQFDFSQKGWVSGKGRSAVWREIDWQLKHLEPQFCMSTETFAAHRNSAAALETLRATRLGFMDVSSSTNSRTMIASAIPGSPCGNKVPVLYTPHDSSRHAFALLSVLNSFAFDFQLRRRLGGLSLNYFIIEETALPAVALADQMLAADITKSIAASGILFAPDWVTKTVETRAWRSLWALTPHERMRLLTVREVVTAVAYGLDKSALRDVLIGCDHSRDQLLDGSVTRRLDPRGFWRIDKKSEPELRRTVLALVAFEDLTQKIQAAGSCRRTGIAAFIKQNDGEGWMLPETLRLADYGLGHDDRAKQHHPVASCFGPRFFDWQLAQDPEESWRECHLHARNLLGEAGYKQALARSNGARQSESSTDPVSSSSHTMASEPEEDQQGTLFPGELA